jgi:hypothetical protein
MHFGLPDALTIPCFAALIFSAQSDSGPARALFTKALARARRLVVLDLYAAHSGQDRSVDIVRIETEPSFVLYGYRVFYNSDRSRVLPHFRNAR